MVALTRVPHDHNGGGIEVEGDRVFSRRILRQSKDRHIRKCVALGRRPVDFNGRSRVEAELAFAVQPNRVPVLVAGRSLL